MTGRSREGGCGGLLEVLQYEGLEGEMQRFLQDSAGTKVVNMRREGCDVKVDRQSKWGNPFVIGRDGHRREVVRK